MIGKWPEQYHANPFPDKTIEEIWDDLDGYSFEELYELPDQRDALRFYVAIPPLFYKGKFIKGFCFSQGAHFLIEQFPDIQDLFFVCAYSMCSSYPWAHKADCFFTCYRNPAREKYYKTKYPSTKDIICIPLQDADFTNEERMYYIPNTPKTIDVFCISTAFPVKNMPMIANALKIYEKKYGYRLKVVYAIGDRAAKRSEDGTFDYSGVSDYSKTALRAVDEILGNTRDYIDFYPYIEYDDLPKFYSASKCGVLASLLEGKNRFIREGMCCNMPIIIFKDLNKFARGDYPEFFGNSGEYIPEFTPESMADTIHKVITNPNAYSPRKNYLKHGGRANFVNTILREMTYYQENIPNFGKGIALKNRWLNKACLNNYGIDYKAFLYDKRYPISNVASVEYITNALKYYYKKFHIPWREIPEELHEPIRRHPVEEK